MAKKLHPDVCKAPNAAAAFQKVQEAYGVLSDDLKRQDYDGQGRPSSTHYSSRPPSGFTESAGFPHGSAAFDRFSQRLNAQQAAYQFYTEQDKKMRQQAMDQQRHFEEAFEQMLFGRRFDTHQSHPSSSVLSLFIRFLPILALPLALLASAVWLSAGWEKVEKGEKELQVVWDSQGKAWVLDAFGERHRFEGFDRR